MNSEGTASIDLSELPKLKTEAANGCDFAPRLSTGLAIRLLTTARADAAYVLRAITVLETVGAPTATKPASQFKHHPLYPFWHQHFIAPRHILPNIGLRWDLPGKGNGDLGRMINEVAKQHGEAVGRWPVALTDRLVIGGYSERASAGRLTGDWIIFAKSEGANYYLDLATHEEGRAERACNLLEKLKGSSAFDFPFLFVH